MMKRIISTLLVCVLLVCSVFALASCSKVSQKYADKINEAAENKEYYTVEEVMDDLGDEAIEITLFDTGVIVAVKGCESVEEIEEKLDAGDEVKGIVIAVAGGKALSAEYRVIEEDDLK